jgi:ribosomal protein L37AE/L43A
MRQTEADSTSNHFSGAGRARGVETAGLSHKRRFSSELACRKYLVKVRWPEGFVCPHCGSERAWRTGRGLWLCGNAGAVFLRQPAPCLNKRESP